MYIAEDNSFLSEYGANVSIQPLLQLTTTMLPYGMDTPQPLPMGDLNPIQYMVSCPTELAFQAASQSLQPFLQGSRT